MLENIYSFLKNTYVNCIHMPFIVVLLMILLIPGYCICICSSKLHLSLTSILAAGALSSYMKVHLRVRSCDFRPDLY